MSNTRDELVKWQQASHAQLRARYRAELEAETRFFVTALEALGAGGLVTVPTQLDADTRRALAAETATRRLLLVREREYWLEYTDGRARVRGEGWRHLGHAVPTAGDGLVAADDEHFVVQAGGRFWEFDYHLRKRQLQPFSTALPLRGAYVEGVFGFYALGSEYLELPTGLQLRFRAPMAFDCSAMYPVAAAGAEDAMVVVQGRPQRWRLTHWTGSPVRFLLYEGRTIAIYGGVAYHFLNRG